MINKEDTATRVLGNMPLWRRIALRTDAWKNVLGASGFLCRHMRYGICDMPTVPFKYGRRLPSIPQTEKDLSFAWDKISKDLAERVIEEVPRAVSYTHLTLPTILLV